MAITRWKPFTDIGRWEPFGWQPLDEIERMHRQMDRLFDRMASRGNGLTTDLAFMPSAELEETDDAINLKLEIPGLEAKDLDIEVTEDTVEVKGERKSETKTEEQGMIRSEFQYGAFDRVIPLPTHVQGDKAKAEYKNGILNLTLPKVAEEQRKTVKINVS